MRFSKKHQSKWTNIQWPRNGNGIPKEASIQMDKYLEAKKWVIAGIAIRAPLKPISTKPSLPCPPQPRKRLPASTYHFNGGREFFNPPDLESIFICHAGRAN
ncbi:cyclin-dependent protein kinase inhibitor SMR6-like [Salvia splendens]|uniref:cyclin-dependent protein kinase inhibitor SMR6-like n=1 Tax=Salvia splendens TaxID=180675 RepID=UPI001C27299D|nr:cyclin-dependent protein kinase inhibitor SMR6-like [Salvia splendens]